MNDEKDFTTENSPEESREYTISEQELFWRNKWRSEHKINMFIGFVFSPVLVFLLRWRGLVEMSTTGWVIALLVFWLIDLLYYYRRMNEYVMAHMANKTDSDHDPDDDRFYKGNDRV